MTDSRATHVKVNSIVEWDYEGYKNGQPEETEEIILRKEVINEVYKQDGWVMINTSTKLALTVTEPLEYFEERLCQTNDK